MKGRRPVLILLASLFLAAMFMPQPAFSGICDQSYLCCRGHQDCQEYESCLLSPGMCPGGTPCNPGDTCWYYGSPYPCFIIGQCEGGSAHGVPCDVNNPEDPCLTGGGECIPCPPPCETPADCDDGDLCTVDNCVDGLCQYAAVDCNDGNGCTIDTCDPASGCVNTAATHACANPNPGGVVPCTQDADCAPYMCIEMGHCQGGVMNGEMCTNEFVGACSNWAGFCRTREDCPVGTICHPIGVCESDQSYCMVGVRQCSDWSGVYCDVDADCASPATCEPLFKCLGPSGCPGTSCFEDTDCAEGETCTGDWYCCESTCASAIEAMCPDGTCHTCPVEPCETDPDCDDGSLCTEDACVDGICQYATVDCNDGNGCTIDTCDPGIGCVNTPATGVCADPNAVEPVPCSQDADCAPHICLEIGHCEGGSKDGGMCVQEDFGMCSDFSASCRTEADCPAGTFCKLMGICEGTEDEFCHLDPMKQCSDWSWTVCDTDDHCTPPATCEPGFKCVGPSGCPGTFCFTDADCAEGEACSGDWFCCEAVCGSFAEGACPEGTCRECDPTLVELIAFTATGQAGSVLIQWETASEIDHEGFNLWRSEAEAGPYARINAALIPGMGGPFGGADYEHTDADVVAGKTYFYKLEALDIFGQSEFFGPVSATVSRGWGAASTVAAGSKDGASVANSLVPFLAVAAFLLAWKGLRRRQGICA